MQRMGLNIEYQQERVALVLLEARDAHDPERSFAVVLGEGIAGQQRTPAQEAAWNRLKAYADRFVAADKILIGVPMWNFAIPYKLKHLIDVVSHKDLLFTFDERGLNGLLTKQKAMVIYARGIGYDDASGTPAAEWDHQKPYMDLWFKFVGVPNVQSYIVEKTLFGEDPEAIRQQAAKLGRSF